MSLMPRLKVLVSGSGIAGPCFAYWLSKTHLDVDITLIERSPVPRVTGQAVDIRGSAIEIVKKMNLEEPVKASHTTEEGTIFVNSKGKTFATFEAGPGDSFTAEYEILRADLANLFLGAIREIKTIKNVYGDSIKSLNQTKEGVNVTFSKGDKEEKFDFVVAAEGSTSSTRAMILDESILKDCYKPLGQYIAFFSIPRIAEDRKLWQWYNTTKGKSIMLRPHKNPKTMGAYLCITMASRKEKDVGIEEALQKGLPEQKKILREYLEDAGWIAKRVLDGMDASEDFYMSRIAQVKLSKWTNNRVVLLGDSAFATFGIATSLAIESAYILAGELSKMKSSKDVPEALERYEQVFRSAVADMGDVPPFFPQGAMPQTAWGLYLRDTLIWLVSKTRIYKWFQNSESRDHIKLPIYEWKMYQTK